MNSASNDGGHGDYSPSGRDLTFEEIHTGVSHLTCIKLKVNSYYKEIYCDPHSVLYSPLLKEKQSGVNSLRHDEE